MFQAVLKRKTRKKYYSEKQLLYFTYYLMKGLKYLHEKGITHNIITPYNLIITESNENNL